MEEKFDFQKYMSDGVARIVTSALRATLKNPRESAFMTKFAAAAKAASQKRMHMEKTGEHIPAFLIASITSACNLHCAGCYSRTNHACSDDEPVEQLTGEDWGRIFDEADELGISFILLAGGEPLMRQDVMREASQHEKILFPIFTNGYFISEEYLELFDKHRNLLPVISIEGDEAATDARRGAGTYGHVMQSMQRLGERGIIFGASITVTTQNMEAVYSKAFLEHLSKLGCKAVVYVEFVPMAEKAKELAPGDAERSVMQKRLARIREEMPEMVFVAFPGDEKTSGGCVAGGRGFFHINSHGGAEPCPFSPYSDINVKETSLKLAVQSELFRALQNEGILSGEHVGGCVLFEKKEEVERALRGT